MSPRPEPSSKPTPRFGILYLQRFNDPAYSENPHNILEMFGEQLCGEFSSRAHI